MSPIYNIPHKNQAQVKKRAQQKAFSLAALKNKRIINPTYKENKIISSLIVSLYRYPDFKPRNKTLAEWHDVSPMTIYRLKKKYWDVLFRIERRFNPRTGLEIASRIHPMPFLFEKEFLREIAQIFSLPFWLLVVPLSLTSLEAIIQTANEVPVYKSLYINNLKKIYTEAFYVGASLVNQYKEGGLAVSADACSESGTLLTAKSEPPFSLFKKQCKETPHEGESSTYSRAFPEDNKELRSKASKSEESPAKGKEHSGVQNEAISHKKERSSMTHEQLINKVARCKRNVGLTKGTYERSHSSLDLRWLEHAEKELNQALSQLERYENPPAPRASFYDK